MEERTKRGEGREERFGTEEVTGTSDADPTTRDTKAKVGRRFVVSNPSDTTQSDLLGYEGDT